MKKQRIRPRLGGRKFYYLLVVVVLFGYWLLIEDETIIDGQWQIELRAVDRQPLSTEVRDFILTSAQTTLISGRSAELQETVALLADDPRIAEAKLFRSDRQRVVIFVDVHRPLLITKVNGRWHYLSEEGKIYAVAERQDYPQLLGVLTDGYLLDSEDVVIVEPKEQQIIGQAIDLFTMARDGGLSLQKLLFEDHRGFRVKITGSDTEIFLGNAPFAAKLHKLREILVSLQAKNRQATRIELDYIDKAFIKEKT